MIKDEDFLIKAVSDGDERAFDRLMDIYSPMLYHYAYGIVGSKELAEEVVSDVFLDVWKLGGALSEVNSLKNFLNTIVYRKSISYIRKEMRRKSVVSIEDVQNFHFPVMETASDKIISCEEIDRLNGAIDRLPPKCKHVFYLAKIECMPYADICEQLGIALPTVDYHVKYAMNFLKRILKKAYFLLLLL